MAKMKAYTVRRAFAARHKESNEEVWVTRENEHLIPDMLTAARIKDYVESGALEEFETDGAVNPATEGFAKATPAAKHSGK